MHRFLSWEIKVLYLFSVFVDLYHVQRKQAKCQQYSGFYFVEGKQYGGPLSKPFTVPDLLFRKTFTFSLPPLPSRRTKTATSKDPTSQRRRKKRDRRTSAIQVFFAEALSSYLERSKLPCMYSYLRVKVLFTQKSGFFKLPRQKLGKSSSFLFWRLCPHFVNLFLSRGQKPKGPSSPPPLPPPPQRRKGTRDAKTQRGREETVSSLFSYGCQNWKVATFFSFCEIIASDATLLKKIFPFREGTKLGRGEVKSSCQFHLSNSRISGPMQLLYCRHGSNSTYFVLLNRSVRPILRAPK